MVAPTESQDDTPCEGVGVAERRDAVQEEYDDPHSLKENVDGAKSPADTAVLQHDIPIVLQKTPSHQSAALAHKLDVTASSDGAYSQPITLITCAT